MRHLPGLSGFPASLAHPDWPGSLVSTVKPSFQFLPGAAGEQAIPEGMLIALSRQASERPDALTKRFVETA